MPLEPKQSHNIGGVPIADGTTTTFQRPANSQFYDASEGTRRTADIFANATAEIAASVERTKKNLDDAALLSIEGALDEREKNYQIAINEAESDEDRIAIGNEYSTGYDSFIAGLMSNPNLSDEGKLVAQELSKQRGLDFEIRRSADQETASANVAANEVANLLSSGIQALKNDPTNATYLEQLERGRALLSDNFSGSELEAQIEAYDAELIKQRFYSSLNAGNLVQAEQALETAQENEHIDADTIRQWKNTMKEGDKDSIINESVMVGIASALSEKGAYLNAYKHFIDNGGSIEEAHSLASRVRSMFAIHHGERMKDAMYEAKWNGYTGKAMDEGYSYEQKDQWRIGKKQYDDEASSANQATQDQLSTLAQVAYLNTGKVDKSVLDSMDGQSIADLELYKLQNPFMYPPDVKTALDTMSADELQALPTQNRELYDSMIASASDSGKRDILSKVRGAIVYNNRSDFDLAQLGDRAFSDAATRLSEGSDSVEKDILADINLRSRFMNRYLLHSDKANGVQPTIEEAIDYLASLLVSVEEPSGWLFIPDSTSPLGDDPANLDRPVSTDADTMGALEAIFNTDEERLKVAIDALEVQGKVSSMNELGNYFGVDIGALYGAEPSVPVGFTNAYKKWADANGKPYTNASISEAYNKLTPQQRLQYGR